MASLGELLAKQAEARRQTQAPPSTSGTVASVEPQVNPTPGEIEGAQKAQPQTQPVAVAKVGGLGALLAAQTRVTATLPVAGALTARAPAAMPAEIEVDEPDSEIDDPELQEQDGLNALDRALATLNANESQSGGIAGIAGYSDHIPATQNLPAKPERDLAADAEGGIKGFVSLIDQVYSIYDDPELLANVIRSIMVELKANPQYMQQVRKEDVHLWVKAMRENMGLAVIKKTEAKAKKNTTGKSALAKSSELDAIAASLGMDFSKFGGK